MKSEKDFDISIVTVGMNHLKYLKPLLESIFEINSTTLSFEIIYVDNCSQDESLEYIKLHYPQVITIANEKPLGFGENNNKGVNVATGKYIAIINPDIVLLKDSLHKLYDFAEKLNSKAILAPQLLNPDLSLQYSARRFMTLKIFLTRLITKGKDDVNNKIIENYLFRNIKADKIQYVDWIIGAAMFMKKDTYNQLKGFDQSYFLYVEDEDFCLRAWKSKIPVIYYPDSKMIHNHLRASSQLGKKAFLHFKGVLIFFLKHGLFVKRKKDVLILDGNI